VFEEIVPHLSFESSHFGHFGKFYLDVRVNSCVVLAHHVGTSKLDPTD